MNGTDESKARLAGWLGNLGFEIAKAGAGKRWVVRKDGTDINLLVTAHRDGRQADYSICNAAWNPIQ